jgi:hypothetical protein
MSALISAELLRLRTVRAPRYVALWFLALVAINAAPFLNGGPSTPHEVTDQVRSLAVLGVFLSGAYAAYIVGEQFKRGSVAMTYLSHPRRGRVAAADAITYAGLSFVFAGVAAAVVLGIVLPLAHADHVSAGLSAADIALVIGGAAFGGAVLGAAGALLGTVARHPAIAMGAIVAWNLSEALLTQGGTRGGIAHYLPFQLVGSATGLTGDVPVVAAMGLLLAYLAAFGLAVRKWALARDLT